MSISLFPHNQKAYDSLLEMLKVERRACIIHPTGTGKSFIGFKYCEDHPEQSVLWLSPSEYIFKTQCESLAATGAQMPKNITFMTYAKLSILEQEELDSLHPDVVILDEMHRAAAPTWEQPVQSLIAQKPEPVVIGLTATHIRYLDGQKDTTETFNLNIASEMTLGEAIPLGILTPPRYILSVYSYVLGYFRIRSLAFSQFLADFFSVIIIYIAVSVAWLKIHNPWPFIPMLVIQEIWNSAWSYFGTYFYYRVASRYHTVVIYRSRRDLDRFGDISGKPIERLFNIEKYIQYDGADFFEIKDELAPYDALFAAGINPTLMNALCKYCAEENVRGFFLPHIGDVIMSGAEHIKSFTTPVLSVRRATKSFEYLFAKRLFDIFASGLGLIILSPFMLLTAILIKAYDGGPVFYKQVRLTKDGKQFKIVKFRSMRVDAEKDGVARLSTGDKDPRITPVGCFIRACRLDELPQLINILRGDMSIVGPRPERPEIAAVYEKILPGFNLRLQVKAGLTGYAQVYGKYNTNPYEKLEFDLLYINQMNLLTDLELMFNTFRILFSKESTEGAESLTSWMGEEVAEESEMVGTGK